jgi:hypothetical protein
MKYVLVIMAFGGASGGAAIDTRVEFVSQRAEARCNAAADILNSTQSVWNTTRVVAKCIQVGG